MSVTTDTPPESPPPSGGGRALPWQAVAAATVLALTAAVLVFVALGGTDDDDAGVATDAATLELTPADGVERDDAIDTAFTELDGSTATLRERLEGRPLVVNFFASWCPPCISEMPEFETVSDELAGRVDFVGLAVQDRPEDATRIVDQTGIDYFWARDILGDIVGAVGVVQMPTTMFVDADGRVVSVHAGTLDADGLRAEIADAFGIQA